LQFYRDITIIVVWYGMLCSLLGIYGRLEENCGLYFFLNVGHIRGLYISKSRRGELNNSHLREIW